MDIENGFPIKKCTMCGKEHTNHYDGEISDIMNERGVCFHCAFWIWQHSVDEQGKRDFAIIDGHHYVLEPHTDIAWPVGMGGAEHRIRFNDGREVVCDNLWHQGEIPEHFRDVMPDNAVFVKPQNS